jgi:hypothetical protein
MSTCRFSPRGMPFINCYLPAQLPRPLAERLGRTLEKPSAPARVCTMHGRDKTCPCGTCWSTGLPVSLHSPLRPAAINANVQRSPSPSPIRAAPAPARAEAPGTNNEEESLVQALALLRIPKTSAALPSSSCSPATIDLTRDDPSPARTAAPNHRPQQRHILPPTLFGDGLETNEAASSPADDVATPPATNQKPTKSHAQPTAVKDAAPQVRARQGCILHDGGPP